MGSWSPITRIAIVGGGPTGIAFAKYLLAERAFDKIDIFEQRRNVGGVWNLSGTDRTRHISVPQEDPRYGSQAWSSIARDADLSVFNNDSLEFESPLYDYLEANIPKQLMQYSDTPFPEHYPLYPSHQEALEYLERYADEVKHLIRFETQVQNVKPLKNIPGSQHEVWEITFRDLKAGTLSKAVYDAVVVANGHYTVPHVVSIEGVAEWNQAYPEAILHSKAYRRPEAFKDQNVLVIGNSASGTDLATQIGAYSAHMYLSSKSKSIFALDSKDLSLEEIDEVIQFLPPQHYHRAAKTKTGRIIENLDTVIFATGYFYSFPFLSELDPPIITDGLRTRDTYQHFMHIEHPTLAFPVQNIKVIPFGLAENQAAVIARIWSGRLPTPTESEMRAWEEEEFKRKGTSKHFHLKKFPEDAAQMNDLYRWALSAMPSDGLENNGVGKMGMHWDRRKVWLRSQFAAVKPAYNAKGAEKRKIRTVEELGFNYDQWLESAKPEDLVMFEKAKVLE